MTQQKGKVSLDGADAVDATVEVGDDTVSIVPQGGDPISLGLVDIDDLFDDDYTLRLTDYTGKRYDLSMLGTAYGQVLAEVRKNRNDALQHQLLLTGVKMQDAYPGKLLGGAQPEAVEVRLFEDAMTVVPERAQMWGLPYSFIDGVSWDQDLYQLHVRADDGADHVFGQFAKRSEELRDELKRLMDALAARTSRTLQGLLPSVEPGLISKLSGVMRDGRAVQQNVVDAIDPKVWPLLENVVVGTDALRETYEHLKSLSPPGWVALGVKSVLSEGKAAEQIDASRQAANAGVDESGELTDDASIQPVTAVGDEVTHLWFFCPLTKAGKPANAIAQEITSESGHATYVYRPVEPERFASLSGEALAAAVTEGMSRINRAILTLNFRREPIYTSEAQLQTPAFSKYLVALRLLDYLRFTRAAFVGRAIHNATWADQIEQLLGQA